MKIFRAIIAAAAVIAVPLAAQLPDNWEGLTKVRSPRADAVYLLPGVDFRTYTKVKFDPTEVAFRRNFQRNYNIGTRGVGSRLDDREIARISEAARTGFEEIFADAFRQAGYEVVTEAGPDVLRLRTGILDLYITAPEQMTAGRVRTYSAEAGEAVLFIEARDSLAGTLLGRAVDRQVAGDYGGAGMRRNSVTNIGDFEQVFRTWARAAVRGLEELKAQSPVSATTRSRR